MAQINQPLLSIAIPTYNRSEILDKTLNSLFSNPDFDSTKIEVIVSDNCSTDNTSEIVAKYPQVRYYRNEQNIRDENFALALNYAIGRYIRLCNDTVYFKPNSLKIILAEIDKYPNSDVNLLFYRNIFCNRDCKKEIKSANELIKEVSFFTTWIGNFGIWKTDFEKMADKNRCASKLFVQVDWTYRLIDNGKKTLILFGDFFEIEEVKNKGGYAIFKTFAIDYLSIAKTMNISALSYEIEKYRLWRNFIWSWMLNLFANPNHSLQFETQGWFSTLFRRYWYEPYFYPTLIALLYRRLTYTKKSSQ